MYFPCGHRILLCSFIFHAAIEVEIRKNFMILPNHFLSKLRNDAFYYRSEDWKRDCTDFCFLKRDPCPRKTLKRSTDIQIFETFPCNLESVDNPNIVFYLGTWTTSFYKGYTFRKNEERYQHPAQRIYPFDVISITVDSSGIYIIYHFEFLVIVYY